MTVGKTCHIEATVKPNLSTMEPTSDQGITTLCLHASLLHFSIIGVLLFPAEFVVMTTKKTTIYSTIVTVENRKLGPNCSQGNIFLGSGPHRGILIRKDVDEVDDEPVSAHNSIEFRSFLMSKTKGTRLQDNCRMDFWFKATTPENRHLTVARDFIDCLLPPDDLPGDYICLISKMLKMMRTDYQQQLAKVRLQTTTVATPPLITVQDCEGIPIEPEIFEPVTSETPMEPADVAIDQEVGEQLTLATDLGDADEAALPDEDTTQADFYDTCSLMLDQTEGELLVNQTTYLDQPEEEYFDPSTSLEDPIDMVPEQLHEQVPEQPNEQEQSEEHTEYSEQPLVNQVLPFVCVGPPHMELDHNKNAITVKKSSRALIPFNRVYNKGKSQPLTATIFNIMTHLIRFYMIF